MNVLFFPGYPVMGAWLNRTGRPILYSCSWPAYQVGKIEVNCINVNNNIIRTNRKPGSAFGTTLSNWLFHSHACLCRPLFSFLQFSVLPLLFFSRFQISKCDRPLVTRATIQPPGILTSQNFLWWVLWHCTETFFFSRIINLSPNIVTYGGITAISRIRGRVWSASSTSTPRISITSALWPDPATSMTQIW